jgi:hypothetical protein
MNSFECTFTEDEFCDLSGLRYDARNRYEGLGFIHPRHQGTHRFYSQEDLKLVLKMNEYLDGKHNLATAYRKAKGGRSAGAV